MADSFSERIREASKKDYTLNDIFVKNYEKWLAAPLFIYLLTPIVHMIVFAILYSEDITYTEGGYDWISHFVNTGEYPGDYYSPIIHFSFLLSSLFAIIAVVSFLVYKRENNIKRFPDSIPLTLFCAYAVIIVVSTIINKTSFNYILGFTPRAEGVISLFVYYFVFYLCGSLIRNENIKYCLIYFFLATSVVIGMLTIINEYFVDVSIIGDNNLCGIFYHWNFYAYYLTISITLAGALTVLDKCKKRRIVSLIIFAFNTFILAINDSLGGFFASIVALLFLLFIVSLKNHRVCFAAIGIFALFLAIIFITGLFIPSFFSELTGLANDVERIATDTENAGDAGTARWTLWTHTWEYIKEKPIIGWGYEGISERLATDTHADRTHNEYLENMAFFGIPAGIIYLASLISIYLKATYRRKKLDNVSLCCLIGALGYIGSALVGNSFIFIAPFCFIFLGLGSKTIEYSPSTIQE